MDTEQLDRETNADQRERLIVSHRFYVANSVLVICVCIPVTSLGLSAVVGSWDPCSVVGGLIILPISALVGILQYHACFRDGVRAAHAVGTFCYFGGGLLVFGFVSTLCEAIWDWQTLSLNIVPILSILLLIGTYGLLCGWLNRRWTRVFKHRREVAASTVDSQDHRPASESGLGPYQFTLRELMAATTVVAVIAGLTSYFVQGIPEQHGLHISRDEAPFDLPEGASNVCYANGMRGARAYEFNIDEEGFLRWADTSPGSIESQSANVPLEKITTPFSITRYTRFMTATTKTERVTISRGYSYCWSKEDRSVRFAYDLDTQTAYYYCHWH
jgi:hypothetical protein